MEPTRTYDIEGQPVHCYELDGDRLWRCECERFKRNLERFGEGFCPHVAVAIELYLEEADGTG
jgi:hypothetical protein